MTHTAKTALLSSGWDLQLTPEGNILLTSGALAIAQNLANEIRLWTNDAYYQQENGIAWKDLWLGVALFITGAAISYLLVRYQRGKDAEANAAKAAEAAEIQVKGDTGNEQQS